MIRPFLSNDVKDKSHRQYDVFSRNTPIQELNSIPENEEMSTSSSYSVNMRFIPRFRKKVTPSLTRTTSKNFSNPDMIPLYQVDLSRLQMIPNIISNILSYYATLNSLY